MNQSNANVFIVSVTQGRGHGAERMLEYLLEAWDCSLLGIQLTLIAPPDSAVYQRATQLGHSCLAFPSPKDSIVHNMLAACKTKNISAPPTLLHAWTTRAYEASLLLGKKLNIPVTATLHDHPQAQFLSKPRQKLLKYSAKKMKQVICVSDALRNACEAAGYKKNLTTIHNGLPDIAWETRTIPSPLRIGFLGMYSNVKGFELLSECIRLCPLHNYVWKLYGKPLPEYKKSVHDLNRSDVCLEGHQTTNTIFKEIDVLFHFSTQFDSFPTVLLEAARSGVPAIAKRGGGASEIVIDQQTGILFDSYIPVEIMGQITPLLKNHDQLRAMGTMARSHFIEHFDSSRMVTKYASLWERTSHRA